MLAASSIPSRACWAECVRLIRFNCSSEKDCTPILNLLKPEYPYPPQLLLRQIFRVQLNCTLRPRYERINSPPTSPRPASNPPIPSKTGFHLQNKAYALRPPVNIPCKSNFPLDRLQIRLFQFQRSHRIKPTIKTFTPAKGTCT